MEESITLPFHFLGFMVDENRSYNDARRGILQKKIPEQLNLELKKIVRYRR